MVKVSNILSSAGNPTPNQSEIRTEDGIYFQSYETVIAFISFKDKVTYLDAAKWNFSSTTNKYRNIFLGEKMADTRKKIQSGEYVLTDLNKN